MTSAVLKYFKNKSEFYWEFNMLLENIYILIGCINIYTKCDDIVFEG